MNSFLKRATSFVAGLAIAATASTANARGLIRDAEIENTIDRLANPIFAAAGLSPNSIDIYIAAEKPEGVPEENWLPFERGDTDLDVNMRLYSPDLEKFKNWTAPKAKKL